VRAVVTTAAPLDAPARRQIEDALCRLSGREVVVVTEVDETLLAGVVAQIGHVLIDGSLRSRMERLRRHLAGTRR